MRIAIVGAGGVGALVGGLLARSGVEVAFVARGAHLAALRARGLEVKSAGGAFHVGRVEAADDPSALAPADAVLVAVKGWQVKEVAPRLAPLLKEGGFAVPLENGVDAADELARALGEERVAGGLCFMLSWLEAALTAAGVEARVVDDVDAAAWEKFVFISPVGSVGAVTRAPMGVVRSLPETRALLTQAMEEIAAVGRARGVRLAADVTARAFAIVDRMPADATASMQRDIQAGRPSELLDQTGAVVRMGREVSVAVPANAFMFASLLPQEQAARQKADARGGASATPRAPTADPPA
jgi:2-dehydropantoate 2-reductase